MRKDFIYLASASPRRCALLEQIGVPFQARPAAVCEARRPRELVGAYVTRVARDKADKIWDEVAASEARPVLAADTAIVIDRRILGKPRDTEEALQMLADLSGRSHRVLTAVVVRYGSRVLSELSASKVRFRVTTERERLAYCATGEPLDKAGSYAIQGMGAIFIEHISGSYSSVMGLPVAVTALLLAEFGCPTWLDH
ncbi:MAG: Maf family protein [Gammaproteobacteria bacterium]|nr:Maf family protein [Gammaproteobacteria bacterium]